MTRAIILGFIFWIGFLSLASADTAASNPAPVTDPVQIRAHYREVLAHPEYREVEESDITSRLKESLSRWFLQLGAKFGQFQYSGEMPAFASLLMTLLVILCVASLLYVMIRVTRRRGRMELEPVEPSPGPRTLRAPESYDTEIQQALHANNWHGAWMATWRQFLSRLENRHLVEADRTRTNREYLAQLDTKALPESSMNLLIAMVDAYDRTIYGKKTVAEPDWNQFHRQVEEAALLLHLNEKSAASRLRPSDP